MFRESNSGYDPRTSLVATHGDDLANLDRQATQIAEARERAAAIEAVLLRIKEFVKTVKKTKNLRRENSDLFKTLVKVLSIGESELGDTWAVRPRVWSTHELTTGQGIITPFFIKLARAKLTTGEANPADVERVLTSLMEKAQAVKMSEQELRNRR